MEIVAMHGLIDQLLYTCMNGFNKAIESLIKTVPEFIENKAAKQ